MWAKFCFVFKDYLKAAAFKILFSVVNSAGITEVLWSNSGVYTQVQGGCARACQMPYFSQDGAALPFSGAGTAQPGSSAALFSSTRGSPVGNGTVAAQQN